MRKKILSALFGISALTTTVHAYYNSYAPYDYRQGLDDYQRREQERLDRLPKQQHIYPDGNGGYYYYN